MDLWMINSWINLGPAQSTFVCLTVWLGGRAWGFVEHGADTGEHEDKESRRRRAPILGAACVACRAGWNMVQRRGNPPPTRTSCPGGGHSGLIMAVKQIVWMDMGICRGSSESLSTPVQIITVMHTNLSEAVGMHPHKNKRTQNRHARSCLRWNWRIFFFWVLNAHS